MITCFFCQLDPCLCGSVTISDGEPVPVTFVDTSAGSACWRELHANGKPTEQWLAKWELTIPNFGCACNDFYIAWKAKNPPDFSSDFAFWLWGFRLHNAVNRKLGKPELTYLDAIKLWRMSNADATDECKTDSRGTVQEVSRP